MHDAQNNFGMAFFVVPTLRNYWALCSLYMYLIVVCMCVCVCVCVCVCCEGERERENNKEQEWEIIKKGNT